MLGPTHRQLHRTEISKTSPGLAVALETMETAASLVILNSVRTQGLDQVTDSIDQTSKERTIDSSTSKTIDRIVTDRTEMAFKVVHRMQGPHLLLADLLFLRRADPAQMQDHHNSLTAHRHGLLQQQRPQALIKILQTPSAHDLPQACKGDQ